MPIINYAKREINAKIVYYGPALSGKTTNLEFIHRVLKSEQKGKLISLATEGDRTLFFDFLPVDIGDINGVRVRFHLYTVPGQIFYNETRRMVLKGVDGIVFVADSQKSMLEQNIESLKNLQDNLVSLGRELKTIPLVFQYNKRDLEDICTIDELNSKLNIFNSDWFESIAIRGTGVLETLSAITGRVYESLKELSVFRPQREKRIRLRVISGEGEVQKVGIAEEEDLEFIPSEELIPIEEASDILSGIGDINVAPQQWEEVASVKQGSEEVVEPAFEGVRFGTPEYEGTTDMIIPLTIIFSGKKALSIKLKISIEKKE